MGSKNEHTDLNNQVVVENIPPIDREKEINELKDLVHRLRGQNLGSSMSTLLEWHGGPGVGKTMLIDLFVQACDEIKVPWVRIDFKRDSEATAAYLRDPSKLLENIANTLARQIPETDLEPFQEKLTAFRLCEPPEDLIRKYYANYANNRLASNVTWLTLMNDLAYEFRLLMDAMTRKNDGSEISPVALFFDETDSADIKLVDWIEEFIISPLARLRSCLIVWTSLRAWNWNRPEVRRRLNSRPLPLFTPEQVKDQWKSIGQVPSLAEALFGNLHTITRGHPYAGRVVISKLNNWTAQGIEVNSTTFLQRETEMREAIFSQFITGYAFRNISPEQATALEYTAMVRYFDTPMLARVLRNCAEELFGSWSMENFGRLILQLKKTQFLFWNKGYTLDPELRYMIRSYYLSMPNPAIFIKVNETALEEYNDWLEQPVDNRSQYILEELYHCASLAQAGLEVNLIEKLTQRLDSYERFFGKNPKVRSKALENLKGELEYDKEIPFANSDIKTQLLDLINRYLSVYP